MENEVKALTKNNRSVTVILLSFIATFILINIVYASMGFYPFGDKTVLIMDAKGQYAEFLTSIRYIGKDNSIFLSWSRAMGGNYLGLAAYYIASPVSLLSLLFPVEQMPMAVYFVEVIKIGLSGMTFAIFLENAFNKRKGNFAVIPFACAYGLMSYNIVYGMCFMWLDGVILLPLVLLGAEKIIQGDKKTKGIIFLIAIAATFITNYYISYSVGIFAALYFVVRLVAETKKGEIKASVVKALKFALNTILAAGIAMPVLLPTLKDLMVGKLDSKGYCPTDIVFNFPLEKFFTKLLPGQYDTIQNTGALPLVYCGVIMVVFALLFFVQKNNKIRDKIGALLIGVFMIMSFYVFKLDVAWHGFQYPNWFPHRYAFLFSAFVVIYAWRAFANLGKIENHKILKEKRELQFFKVKFDTTVIFKKVWYILIAILFVEISFELTYNAKEVLAGLDNEFHFDNIEAYSEFIEETTPLLDEIQKDTGFYRTEKDYEYSQNDPMLLGYNGMTHYSSAYNKNVNDTTRNLGMAQTYFWNSGYGSTLVTDSIFDVKYKILKGKAPSTFNVLSEEVEDDNSNAYPVAYENTQNLSIAFAADKNLSENDIEWSSDPFDNQNRFVSAIIGEENTMLFRDFSCEFENKNGVWTAKFTAASDNPIYMRAYPTSSGYSSMVYVNGEAVGEYFNSRNLGCLYLGEFEDGEEVVVTTSFSGEISYAIFSELDLNKWNEVYTELSAEQFDIDYHKNGVLKGTMNVLEDKTVFTSIPYDEGFTVYVDGKKVKTDVFADTFLTFDISQGEHTIKISYVSPGFFTGLCVAFVTLLIIMFYYKYNSVKKQSDILKG